MVYSWSRVPPRFKAPSSHYLRPIGLVIHLSSARGRDMVAEATELATSIGQGSGVNPWLIAITRYLSALPEQGGGGS
jgi:hypothetical protein